MTTPTDIQTFLTDFNRQYLSKCSGLLSNCQLVSNLSLSEYNKMVTHQSNLRRLPPNQYLWGLVDETGKLISTLHFALLHGCMGGAEPGPQHILQWCYAYTLDDTRYRRQGCSLAIRLATMLWANDRGIDYLNSVPLAGAHSIPLLKSLGFIPFYDGDDDIYYIYHLTNSNIPKLVQDRLRNK